MTKRLFWEDMYMVRTDAQVVDIKEIDRHYHVLTDATIFYPGGGGFPKDRGKINGKKVLDVYDENGDIWHVLPEPIEGKVFMEIDFMHRYDFMQQHTAQHLLSALVYDMADGTTLSMHLGDEYSSIDVDVPPHKIDLPSLEMEALIAISQAREVRVRYYNRGDTLPPTRKPLKWDKIKGDVVRIVEIAGIDVSACGGLHVRNISELAPLLLLPKIERYKGGSRIYFYAGYRAYSMIDEYRKEITRLKAHVDELVSENKRLKKQMISYMVEEIWRGSEVTDTNVGKMIVIKVEDPDMVSAVAKARPRNLDIPILVIGGDRFTFVGPGDIWEQMRAYVRGGGKMGSFSGKVMDREGLQTFLGVRI